MKNDKNLTSHFRLIESNLNSYKAQLLKSDSKSNLVVLPIVAYPYKDKKKIIYKVYKVVTFILLSCLFLGLCASIYAGWIYRNEMKDFVQTRIKFKEFVNEAKAIGKNVTQELADSVKEMAGNVKGTANNVKEVVDPHINGLSFLWKLITDSDVVKVISEKSKEIVNHSINGLSFLGKVIADSASAFIKEKFPQSRKYYSVWKGLTDLANLGKDTICNIFDNLNK